MATPNRGNEVQAKNWSREGRKSRFQVYFLVVKFLGDMAGLTLELIRTGASIRCLLVAS